MASWFEKVATRATKQRRWRRLRRDLATEDGRTCPSCGDLWPWAYAFCCTCGKRLT